MGVLTFEGVEGGRLGKGNHFGEKRTQTVDITEAKEGGLGRRLPIVENVLEKIEA